MVDKDKDFENDEQDLEKGPVEGDHDFSPADPSAEGTVDDFADDMPQVSVTKKKNALVFVVGFGAVLLVVYSIATSHQKKHTGPKTESQEMTVSTQKSVHPSGKTDKDTAKNISASAAMPGAEEISLSVPTNPSNMNQQAALQETLPPPPTLPPVFDPSSVYLQQGGGSSANKAGASSSAYNVYTKKRERLPEIGGASDGSNGGSADADLSGLDPDAKKQLDDERKKRISSSMFVGGAKGGSGSGTGAQKPVSTVGGISTAANDNPFTLSETGAAKTNVTIRKNLNSVILQGKILDAVLETAINTDLPGKLRAILSRDVYSEDGKRVVIPKGSRLIGSYATDIKFGQARVYVIWSRVIRPDGIDAVLDGGDDLVAVDALGRSGVYGDLDNRFFEIFGSSILLSTITVAFAVAADAVSGDSSNTTTTTNSSTGSTTTSSDIASQGTSQAVLKLGDSLSSTAEKFINTKPQITVDQGTRIKIFVNKDIIFPPSYFSSGLTVSGVQFIN